MDKPSRSWSAGCGESYLSGVGSAGRKPTVERQRGAVLRLHGKEYACRIDGLAVGEAGISSADAVGNVYHLTDIEDFSGTYMTVSTGAVLAGGGDVATMRNQRGVVIDLTDTSQGAKIMLAVQGVKITLEGTPTASKRN